MPQGPAATQAPISSWTASTSLPWLCLTPPTCSKPPAETPSCQAGLAPLPAFHIPPSPTGSASQTGLHNQSCSPQVQASGLYALLPCNSATSSGHPQSKLVLSLLLLREHFIKPSPWDVYSLLALGASTPAPRGPAHPGLPWGPRGLPA